MKAIPFVALKDLRDSREFLELRLPAVYVWFILCLVFVLVYAVLWVCLGDLDVVVRAPVVLRTVQNASEVRLVVSGPVAAKDYHHGQEVARGQSLFSLDTRSLEVDRRRTEEQRDRLRAKLREDRELARAYEEGKNNVPVQDLTARARSSYYFAEFHRLELESETARRDWERARAQPPSLAVPQKVEDLERLYHMALLGLETFRTQERVRLEDEKKALLDELSNLEKHGADLERQAADSEVRAPIAGFVDEIRRINPGDSVLAGEVVLRIIPREGRALRAELMVDNRDIAEVRQGQSFLIRFTALPPSEFGFLPGWIRQVPGDTSSGADGAFYRLEGALERISLENRRGDRVDLRAGMTGEARILIKHKRILELLLERLDFF